MRQIDTKVLSFFTYCIMMVVKLATTTAIIKYVLVKFYYLSMENISNHDFIASNSFSAYSLQ